MEVDTPLPADSIALDSIQPLVSKNSGVIQPRKSARLLTHEHLDQVSKRADTSRQLASESATGRGVLRGISNFQSDVGPERKSTPQVVIYSGGPYDRERGLKRQGALEESVGPKQLEALPQATEYEEHPQSSESEEDGESGLRLLLPAPTESNSGLPKPLRRKRVEDRATDKGRKTRVSSKVTKPNRSVYTATVRELITESLQPSSNREHLKDFLRTFWPSQEPVQRDGKDLSAVHAIILAFILKNIEIR
jgi:hypothetical protein